MPITKHVVVRTLLVLVIIAGLGSIAASIVHQVVTFPQEYPKESFDLALAAESFIKHTTLPVKLAYLYTLEPDAQLLMPVYGVKVSQTTDTWGAARSGGRTHEGQDIFAPRGTPIFSATTGYIIRMTDNVLGGNSVFVMGPGGMVYFYTHLDRYADDAVVGDDVTTDTVLGFVGNTGNASSTAPHLHFGMYKEWEAVNPFALIVDR